MISSNEARRPIDKAFRFFVLSLVVVGFCAKVARAQGPRDTAREEQNLSREVYHQLALLPHLTVFDNLSYQVNGDNVTLSGETSQPVNKSDAETAVKGIEGVGTITNSIKVLPLSPMDDQIRRAEFGAIYSFPSLQKYAWNSVQSIHIIVDGGHVTLEGVVDSQSDKDAANVRANSVPNVFSVTNNLQVGAAGPPAKK
jgi:hyperosmotically inducible protein